MAKLPCRHHHTTASAHLQREHRDAHSQQPLLPQHADHCGQQQHLDQQAQARHELEQEGLRVR